VRLNNIFLIRNSQNRRNLSLFIAWLVINPFVLVYHINYWTKIDLYLTSWSKNCCKIYSFPKCWFISKSIHCKNCCKIYSFPKCWFISKFIHFQMLIHFQILFIYFQNAEYSEIILLFILSFIKRSNMVDFCLCVIETTIKPIIL